MAKILIVDDSRTERAFTASVVKKLGHEVLQAEDGQEGIDVAKAENPALIILDVVMPKMDGLSALRIMKKDPDLKKIPVIICSSKNQKNDITWGKMQGATEYITKPLVTPERTRELAEKIMAIVGKG
jgi:twitching motility two-component system response regulator PilH